jgi:hypothetical protein
VPIQFRKGEPQMTQAEFRLYRSAVVATPHFPTSQYYANGILLFDAFDRTIEEYQVDMQCKYGSAATWYRVVVHMQPSVEIDWLSAAVSLSIDSYYLGKLPLTWYNGEATDWTSGVARFPESYGPGSTENNENRGVWTLGVRRVG